MQDGKKTVLITGAGGRIGRSLAQSLAERYTLRLLDRRPMDEAPDGAVTIVADIADADALQRAVTGVEAVVHMGGQGSPYASWDSVLQNNMVALHLLFEASRQAGVRRIVFASSSHACGAHIKEFGSAGPDAPVRPDSFYGVSKAFGEALGQYYSDRLGVSTICLRIGVAHGSDNREEMQRRFQRQLQRPSEYPFEPWQNLSIWISNRDMAQIVSKSIETDLRFGIFYATSNNHPVVLDISEARRLLGYAPEDSVEQILGEPYGPPEAPSPSETAV